MIVSDDELKRIVSLPARSQQQMIAVIRQFIFEKKGQSVDILAPQDMHNALLCEQGYSVAHEYYKNKFDL